jgi:hypothetical protein
MRCPLLVVFLVMTAEVLPARAQTVADAQKQALAKYPDLGREGSPLHTQFKSLYNAAKQSDPAALTDPSWPLTLAERAAAMLGAPPLVQPPSVTPTPAQPATDQTPPAAPGQGKLEGAFGKKLGDIFNPATAIGKSALTDGTPMYQFLPDKPFRSFTRYFVMITPTTHKIYAIWGVGPAANTEAGKKEQALVMELLQQKYGPKDKAGLGDGFYDAEHITQGGRSVLTKITGFTDTTIEVRYEDRTLEKTAEQERLKLEGKKVDPSGL